MMYTVPSKVINQLISKSTGMQHVKSSLVCLAGGLALALSRSQQCNRKRFRW